jgi:transposase
LWFLEKEYLQKGSHHFERETRGRYQHKGRPEIYSWAKSVCEKWLFCLSSADIEGYGTDSISKWPDGWAMAAHRTFDSTSQARRPTQNGEHTGGDQRYSVSQPDWLLLAYAAAWVPAMGHSPLLLSSVSFAGLVAEDSWPPPWTSSSQGRTQAYTQCRHLGQPERQDRWKRGNRGYDAGKKVSGRKRHVLVDTLGLILVVVVHAANIQDRAGGRLVLEKLGTRFRRLKRIWVDGGYAGAFVDLARRAFGRMVEIVKRSDLHQFIVLPKRWVVERTFGWFGKYRRLSKDYETLPSSSETMIYLAMINLMLHRLKPG